MTTFDVDVYNNLLTRIYLAIANAVEEMDPSFELWFEEDDQIILRLKDPDEWYHFRNIIIVEMIESIAEEKNKDIAEIQRYLNGRIHI